MLYISFKFHTFEHILTCWSKSVPFSGVHWQIQCSVHHKQRWQLSSSALETPLTAQNYLKQTSKHTNKQTKQTKTKQNKNNKHPSDSKAIIFRAWHIAIPWDAYTWAIMSFVLARSWWCLCNNGAWSSRHLKSMSKSTAEKRKQQQKRNNNKGLEKMTAGLNYIPLLPHVAASNRTPALLIALVMCTASSFKHLAGHGWYPHL